MGKNKWTKLKLTWFTPMVYSRDENSEHVYCYNLKQLVANEFFIS